MFHQQSAAARDRAASTSLRSVAVLDVLPSTPAGGSRRAPCICSPLIAPRCDRGETSGLGSGVRAGQKTKSEEQSQLSSFIFIIIGLKRLSLDYFRILFAFVKERREI